MLILLICFILEIVALVCYAVKCLVEEAFADPEWMKFDEPKVSQKPVRYMDNSEYELGHDVRHTMEDEL